MKAKEKKDVLQPMGGGVNGGEEMVLFRAKGKSMCMCFQG